MIHHGLNVDCSNEYFSWHLLSTHMLFQRVTYFLNSICSCKSWVSITFGLDNQSEAIINTFKTLSLLSWIILYPLYASCRCYALESKHFSTSTPDTPSVRRGRCGRSLSDPHSGRDLVRICLKDGRSVTVPVITRREFIYRTLYPDATDNPYTSVLKGYVRYEH